MIWEWTRLILLVTDYNMNCEISIDGEMFEKFISICYMRKTNDTLLANYWTNSLQIENHVRTYNYTWYTISKNNPSTLYSLNNIMQFYFLKSFHLFHREFKCRAHKQFQWHNIKQNRVTCNSKWQAMQSLSAYLIRSPRL